MITVTLSGPPLASAEFSDASLMREIGLAVRDQIIDRTRKGLDADGRPFTPYSASYAALKGQALGTGASVDLTVSGQMLNALVLVEVTKDSVTVGYRD
jgi:hypothetical protein